MRMFARIALAAVTAVGLATAAPALRAQELRIMWYSDGNEGDVIRDLLDRFEKQNAGVKINLDRVPYKSILEQLPALLDSGQGPDLARVTDLGGLSRHYLDIAPYVANAAYWTENFGGVLPWTRPAGQTSGIHGLMTQLTLTLPFVNATLFEQAGVPIPAEGATWADWAKAARLVAEKVKAPIPIAMDRSGHRVGGFAISMGAKLFNGDQPALVDDGFKAAAKTLFDWHRDGTMPRTIWGAVGGTAYRGANEEFANGQVVLYVSGTWQIPQFAKTIGSGFDWHAVANPCGPGGCTGMPGGAALVPIKTTKQPQLVGRLLDWLASEPIYAEYHARTLFLPAHVGLAKKGIAFQTDVAQARKSLEIATAQVAKTSPIAFRYQGYANNRAMFNATISRLNQAIAGEMSLDEAYKRMDADVAEALAAKK
ncbi:MAG: carbohydrate ABC transporter substrate-binding protein [Alphaproteobacteria bacterium]|nr:carbohydrate ABC transporter substrate-binding protein [Alphaproteobacteria bacterium]